MLQSKLITVLKELTEKELKSFQAWLAAGQINRKGISRWWHSLLQLRTTAAGSENRNDEPHDDSTGPRQNCRSRSAIDET